VSGAINRSHPSIKYARRRRSGPNAQLQFTCSRSPQEQHAEPEVTLQGCGQFGEAVHRPVLPTPAGHRDDTRDRSTLQSTEELRLVCAFLISKRDPPLRPRDVGALVLGQLELHVLPVPRDLWC
jgi:hypothetical protein